MGPDEDSARGLARLEGYLLWSAEVREAGRRASLFADQLPWLTTAQREEVERVYAADRLALSRDVLLRIAHRATELRAEYSERYRRLRARCLTTVALGCAGALTVLAMLLAVTRPG
ncbi:hypothetical protein ACWGJ2_30605 [Streptomyces sp. NPDC054796]